MQYVWKSLWDSPLIAKYSFYFHKKFNRAYSDLHFVVNRRKNTCLRDKNLFFISTYDFRNFEMFRIWKFHLSWQVSWEVDHTMKTIAFTVGVDLPRSCFHGYSHLKNSFKYPFYCFYLKTILSNIYNIINVLNVLLPRTYVKYKLARHNYS